MAGHVTHHGDSEMKSHDVIQRLQRVVVVTSNPNVETCVCYLVHSCLHRVVHSQQTAQTGRSLQDPLATIATAVQTDWLSASEGNIKCKY